MGEGKKCLIFVGEVTMLEFNLNGYFEFHSCLVVESLVLERLRL